MKKRRNVGGHAEAFSSQDRPKAARSATEGFVAQPAFPRQCITLEGIQLSAYIGVYANEKRSPQPLWVDVELESSLLLGARDDRLESTIDYGAVAKRVIAVAAEHHRNLIETLAFDIATALLEGPHTLVVRVTVHKPGAVPVARDTAVTIELAK